MEDPKGPPPAPASSRRTGLLSVLGIVLVVIGGVLWWALVREDKPDGAAQQAGATLSPSPGGRGQPAASTKIVVEAESGTELVAPFKTAYDDQASGNMCLTIPAKGCEGRHLHLVENPADPQRTAGSVQVPFRVGSQGEYFLWLRKWWCCAEGDSFIVEVDGGRSYIFGDDSANLRQWSWLDLKEGGRRVKFKLGPGRHVLLIRSRGESGFKVDQLLFTTDAGFMPKGIEKPTP